MPIRLPLLLRMQRLIKQLRTCQAEIELELSLLDHNEDNSDDTPAENVTISHTSINEIENDETSIKEACNNMAKDEQLRFLSVNKELFCGTSTLKVSGAPLRTLEVDRERLALYSAIVTRV